MRLIITLLLLITGCATTDGRRLVNYLYDEVNKECPATVVFDTEGNEWENKDYAKVNSFIKGCRELYRGKGCLRNVVKEGVSEYSISCVGLDAR